jgi:hypothetical protein
MSANVSKCQQMSANVSKRQQMPVNASKCQQMSANVSKCHRTRRILYLKNSFSSATVSKCQQLSANVSNCQQMSATVSNCQQMSADVSKCQQNDNDAGISNYTPATHGTDMVFAPGQRVYVIQSRLSVHCRTFLGRTFYLVTDGSFFFVITIGVWSME